MSDDKTAQQLEELYSLSIKHLQISFIASIVALSLGLVVLLIGATLALRGDANASTQLSIIAGVLTQFIGAGFFLIYNKNLKQLNAFYDKLTTHQDTLYSIGIAREIPEQHRTEIYTAIVGRLLSRSGPETPPEVLKAIIDKQHSSSKQEEPPQSTQRKRQQPNDRT